MDEKIRELRRIAVASGDRNDLCNWIAAAKRSNEEFPEHLEYYCDYDEALKFIQLVAESYNLRYEDAAHFSPEIEISRLYGHKYKSLIEKVVEVYYSYYKIDEFQPKMGNPYIEGYEIGLVANVELIDSKSIILWVRNQLIAPDAPDASAERNSITRLDTLILIPPGYKKAIQEIMIIKEALQAPFVTGKNHLLDLLS